MVVGRIAVGVIIFAITLGIFYTYGRINDLPDTVGVLVCLAVILLIAYCVVSGVYLLIKAGVV